MFRNRQYLIFFFFIFLFLCLLSRLFFLQVVSFERFSDMAANQHNRVLKIEPRRGTIFDRFLEPLAINLEVPSVYSDPRFVKDKEEAARKLADILALDRQDLVEKLNRKNAFVWIKRKISRKEAEALEKEAIKGVFFTDESKRNYSSDGLASHVLGFVNIDNKGLEGLELFYDRELKGEPGWRHLVRDARRRTVLYDREESVPPKNGLNLVLTIDSVIQYITEQELKNMAEKHNASGACAVVMEPYSGRILAMASYPDYDLDDYSVTPKEVMKNSCLSSIFEPGSVFKVVTAGAVLNEGTVTMDEVFDCENGEWNVAGRVLHDYHAYGDLSFREVIVNSSNIGTVKAAMKLGEERLYDYIDLFGFGEETGIDLPGEVAGINRHPRTWSRSDITTIPIGQGIAVTPLQMASALSVIANGGRLMRPYIVDRIITLDGNVHRSFGPSVVREVLSEETCSKMKDMLRAVVKEGTGRRADSRLYETCGKTGTAQMVDPKGGYYPDKYYATFIGFAPKEDPEVVIVVSAKDPHPVYFGGSVAGPAFRKIAERSVQYLESNRQPDVDAEIGLTGR
ncbi:MAG: penicillin-binding protein [Candidatus Omnitrophica bacterium]|nr:penicillin-binding protein [Candidatus Omnitrophota bacterium]